jgi:pimeloyl-ACP methyl ester carboxylesterase
LGKRCQAFPDVAFSAIDFAPTPADFFRLTVTGMIGRLRQYILDRKLSPVHLVGSSLGGLVALHYAYQYGGVVKMLLLAPVLTGLSSRSLSNDLTRWKCTGSELVPHGGLGAALPLGYGFVIDGSNYPEAVPPAAPCLIVHGAADSVAPVDDSRQYRANYPDLVQLIEVEAGHDLNSHLDLIWQQVRRFHLDC